MGSKKCKFLRFNNTLTNRWCQKEGLKVVELEHNFYQFIFGLQEEKDRVLLKRLWFFENHIIVLHPWKQNLKSNDELFRKMQMWVQVRGLPNHWMAREVG